GAGAAGRARIAWRARNEARPDRNPAGHGRSHRRGAAVGRRQAIRLADLDVDLAGGRAGDPRGARRIPAAVGPPRRCATAATGAIPAALGARRPDHPARVLVRAGVVLPGAGAVPAARTWDEPDSLRAAADDPGGAIRGGVRAGARADSSLRPAAAGGRGAGAGL